MKRWLFVLAIVALFALPLAVAACGGDDEEETSPTPSPSPSMMAEMDIVDTAVEAGSFTTLVGAVQSAGLEETLRGEGPFTVFAPTDEAFKAVPQETMDALLADPTGALADVLTYHVVPGKVMAADLSDGMMVETVNGAELEVKISDGEVMINDATVVTADVEASNGVIHVIDTVLIPPSK